MTRWRKQVFTASGKRARSADGFRPAGSARISVVSDSHRLRRSLTVRGETLRTCLCGEQSVMLGNERD